MSERKLGASMGRRRKHRNAAHPGWRSVGSGFRNLGFQHGSPGLAFCDAVTAGEGAVGGGSRTALVAGDGATAGTSGASQAICRRHIH